ncbi:MAG: hypothetical protein L0216_00920 [Planctomycetales bacterium]|nr:hypothetical protein [Planctomycetales bacterium]
MRTRSLPLAAALAAVLSSGCGCRPEPKAPPAPSMAFGGAGSPRDGEAGRPTGDGGDGQPATGIAGGATEPGAAPAGAPAPEDPTPPAFLKFVEELEAALDQETFEEIRKRVEAEIKARPEDPLGYLALAALRLQEMEDQRGSPASRDFQAVREAIQTARSRDSLALYGYLADTYESRLLRAEKKPAEALQLLERARAAAPGCRLAQGDLGFLLLEAKEYAKALMHFQEMTRLFPRAWKLWAGRALAHMALRQPQPGIECFEKAKECDPDNIKVRLQLLRLLASAWAETHEDSLRDRVRREIAEARPLAERVRVEKTRKALLDLLETLESQFEAALVEWRIRDIEHMPDADLDYDALFGRVKETALRARLLKAIADGIPDSPSPQRARALLSAARKGPEKTIRYFSLVRVWAYGTAAQMRRSFAEPVLRAMAPHAIPVSWEILANEKEDDEVRLAAVEAIGALGSWDPDSRGLFAELEKRVQAAKPADPVAGMTGEAFNWIEVLHKALLRLREERGPRLPRRDADPGAWAPFLETWRSLLPK